MAKAKPAVYNIFIRKEADWELNITYKDDAGNPIDLTGFSAWFTIREKHESEAVVSLTHSSGITLGGVNGTIDIELTNSQTADLGISKGVYDILLQDDQGTPDRFAIMEGDVEVGRAVTRGV